MHILLSPIFLSMMKFLVLLFLVIATLSSFCEHLCTHSPLAHYKALADQCWEK